MERRVAFLLDHGTWHTIRADRYCFNGAALTANASEWALQRPRKGFWAEACSNLCIVSPAIRTPRRAAPGSACLRSRRCYGANFHTNCDAGNDNRLFPVFSSPSLFEKICIIQDAYQTVNDRRKRMARLRFPGVSDGIFPFAPAIVLSPSKVRLSPHGNAAGQPCCRLVTCDRRKCGRCRVESVLKKSGMRRLLLRDIVITMKFVITIRIGTP